jgi:hypothetical protein
VEGPVQEQASERAQTAEKGFLSAHEQGGPATAILQLQRAAGNAAVTKFVQRKALQRKGERAKPVSISRASGLQFALEPTVAAGRSVKIQGSFGVKGHVEGPDVPSKGAETAVREQVEPLIRKVTPKVNGATVEGDLAGVPLDATVTQHGPEPITVVAYLTPKSVELSTGTLKVTGSADAEVLFDVGPVAGGEKSGGDNDKGALSAASFAGAPAVFDNVTNDKGKVAGSKNVAGAQTAHLTLPSDMPADVQAELSSPIKVLRWLEFMRPWFGSDGATIAHFAGIRSVEGQKQLKLHKDAATRLEAVQNKLGKGNYPQSSVGWSFRGDIQVGQEQRHKHMHKIGYAADFDAYNLPMLTDAKTQLLIALTTGRSHHIQMGTGAKGENWDDYTSRRSMIAQMGAGNADPVMKQHYLDRLGQQMDELAAASERFKGSLGDSGKADFVKLRDQWWDLQANHKPGSQEFEKGKADIEIALKTVLSPWIDKIDAKRAELLAKAKAEKVDLDSPATDPSQVTAITKAERPVATLAKKLAKKPDAKLDKSDLAAVQKLADLLGVPHPEEPLNPDSIRSLLDQAAVGVDYLQKNLAREKGFAGDRASYSLAGQLRKSLLEDLRYVFGTSTSATDKKTKTAERHQKLEVVDPSASQLLDHGYFRMAGDGADEKQRSSQISKAFALAMVQQGFEMGGAWGSSDAMHFEIAVGATPAQVEAHKHGPPAGGAKGGDSQ